MATINSVIITKVLVGVMVAASMVGMGIKTHATEKLLQETREENVQTQGEMVRLQNTIQVFSDALAKANERLKDNKLEEVSPVVPMAVAVPVPGIQ